MSTPNPPRRSRRFLQLVGIAAATATVTTVLPAVAADDVLDTPTVQAPADGASTADTPGDRDARLAEHQARRTEHREAFAQALAAELDLPVGEVTAALEAVGEQFADERAERREHRRERRESRRGARDERPAPSRETTAG